jgi:COP9 signalosome complex subunit 7
MEGNQIEAFVALAKGTHGKGLEALLTQVLEHPQIFTFGEIMDVPSVAQLVQSQAPHGMLLEIFAYGVCADYRADAHLPLSEAMRRKLQTLTIVTCSAKRKIVPYGLLLEALSPLGPINTIDLEDLILNALYCNLLVGKMNQEEQCFEVHWCQARDIRREDLGSIIEGLAAWKSVAESALEQVAIQQNSLRAQAEAYKQQEAETAAAIKENKSLRIAEDEGKRRPRAW